MPPETSIIGALVAGLAAGRHPGVSVTVDWPAFLGCTEADITDTLAGYYRREAERLEHDAREKARLPSGRLQPCFSLDFARMTRDWLATEDCRARP